MARTHPPYQILHTFILMLLTHRIESQEKCPVKSCACSNITLPILESTTFLLNCSNGRMPSLLTYLPLDMHVYPWQHRGPYLPDFSGSRTTIGALDLSRNDISNLKYEGFVNFTELKSLDMSYNDIEQITDSGFLGLRNLRILNLSHNSIAYVERGGLSKLLKLLVLEMNDNILHSLKAGIFQDLLNLQHLSIRGNGLIGIDDGALTSLGNLRTFSLANNNLKALVKSTFIGLDQLETLDLASNAFVTVPGSALAQATSLQNIILDANPINSIPPSTFQRLSIRTLSMNRMPQLKLIERFAFTDLSFLKAIDLSNNPKLIYISPNAFHNVPALKSLNVRNNALQTLSVDIALSVPHLTTLSLSGNPLLCDCSIRWVRSSFDKGTNTDHLEQNTTLSLIEGDIRNEQTDTTSTVVFTIQDADKLKCKAPDQFKNVLVQDLNVADINSSCSPTILKSFATNYQEGIGEDLVLRCIAVGTPEPRIHWISPTNVILNETTNDSRFDIPTAGTIRIDHIKPEDSGTYACKATNAVGSDIRLTVMKVHSNNMHLIIKSMTQYFITFTWNGSDSTMATSDYVLMYRNSIADAPYRTIPLHPYMRAYTFAKLRPQTLYEFCIAYEDKDHVPLPINCRKVRTKHTVHVIPGIKSAKGTKIIISVTVSAFIIAFLCVFSAACRNYKKRKDYDDPEDNGRCGNRRKCKNVQDLSQIPLDNLYNTPSTSIPSTPMYASTTSLISNSKA